TWSFSYVICATGAASLNSTQRAAVKESGTLILDLLAKNGQPPTFAGYGQFVANQPPCPGSFLTPGTYTGPSFTNGAWTLGNYGGQQYYFASPLESVSPEIYWYGANGCPNGSTTVPIPGIPASFPGGTKFGAAAINPPTNSYSQAWAALDGKGYGETGSPIN